MFYRYLYQGVATIKNDGDLKSVVRLYWQSEILSKAAGNDPKADVPPVMDFMQCLIKMSLVV